jgi:hypothetical protein
MPNCTWTYDPDDRCNFYNTSCPDPKAFCFMNGTNDDPDFKFCPYCGREITWVHPTEEEENDDD